MRIFLIDLSSRFPQYTSRLAKALSNKDYQVESLVAGIPRSYSSDFSFLNKKFLNIRDLLFKRDKRNKSYFRMVIKMIEYFINDYFLRRYVFEKKARVLHYQYFPLLEFLPHYELKKIKDFQNRGINVIYTVHNVLPNDSKGEAIKKTYNDLYHMVNALIVHTNTAKAELINDFDIDQSKISVIPHGILGDNLQTFTKEKARDLLNLNKDYKYVLFFGGIVPYKGLEFLLRSWKEVENACLLIVGNGTDNYMNIIKNLIDDLNLQDCVYTRFEYVTNLVLSQYIDASDILVYPYKSITQSGALFLGMGKGKAVVTTNVGGFDEVVEQGVNGLKVDYNNFKQLSEVINMLLLNDEMRNHLGENARNIMQEEYSWEKIAEKQFSLYSSFQ